MIPSPLRKISFQNHPRCVNIWSYQQPSVAWHGHFSTFLPTFRRRNYASYVTMRPITIRHLVDRFAQSPSENGSIEPKHPNHQLRMSMTGCLGVAAFLRRCWTLSSLKLRALLPPNIGKNPKMYTDCLPSIHFQVRAVSFGECIFFFSPYQIFLHSPRQIHECRPWKRGDHVFPGKSDRLPKQHF